MADVERQKYMDDPRIPCKYGAKCYQKNPVHHSKYKHPTTKKRYNDNLANAHDTAKRIKIDADKNEVTKENATMKEKNEFVKENTTMEISDTESLADVNLESDSKKEDEMLPKAMEINENIVRTESDFDHKTFIKEKFLVEMPPDFYSFWDFCVQLNRNKPKEALKAVGLILVGPYDVLAGNFCDVVDQPLENYLIHWRYFYDPPEFQTVLKGDDETGHHIGYFRDSPLDLPVFLASNHAKKDGVFKVSGDNIFAAVYLYLDDLKKTCDPFKKMHIGKFQSLIKKKSEELNVNLSERSESIRNRDKKIVSRSFNKIGIVVPYNRKTQTGYRSLSVSNKELNKMLDNLQKALPEQRAKFLSDLQQVMTNTSIATDECDFGTGIELGQDILAHGIESLNQTIARYLASNYRLIGRENFAKIAEAHMNNRKKGSNLSIL